MFNFLFLPSDILSHFHKEQELVRFPEKFKSCTSVERRIIEAHQTLLYKEITSDYIIRGFLHNLFSSDWISSLYDENYTDWDLLLFGVSLNSASEEMPYFKAQKSYMKSILFSDLINYSWSQFWLSFFLILLILPLNVTDQSHKP